MLPEMTKEEICYSCGGEPSTINKTGEWRFLTPGRVERLSPCRQGCLLDGEIPAWMEAVKQEKWEEAWQIMSQYNPFPALTGYTCFHPCTENCNRGQLDRDIGIPEVEKAIGEWRLASSREDKETAPAKGRVAVVGSGPAGMSCAFYLNRNGYDVTVFEKEKVTGGMFALGIPEYRLPRRILKQELDLLEAEGIKFIAGCAVGRDIPLSELYAEYDEVFLGPGAWKPRRAGIPGEDSAGVYNALEFLSRINTGKPLEIADPVVVIGGGNAAVDSARSALRLSGINHVTLIYRRSRAEMPASQEEVEAAEREGVELICNALPREIEPAGEEIESVIFDHCITTLSGLSVDRSRSFNRPCGTVVMALGQERDYSIFESLDRPATIFAGGDLVSGPATVPEAIRAGRIAAMAIMAKTEGLPGPETDLPGDSPVTFEELNLAARGSLELLDRQEAPAEEAARCLGCGTCNSCGICYLFCPDMAVDIVDGRYELNLDYCKGCGICFKECPARALAMEGGR